MSLDRLVELVAAVLGGGILTALVQGYRAKAQNGLDQAQAWKTLVEQLQSRLEQAQQDNDDLRNEIIEKSGYIEKICKLLTKSGLEVPTYTFRHRVTRSEDK